MPNAEKLSAASPKFKPSLNAVEKKLADILPPREFEVDGQKYIQQVSSQQASRNFILGKEQMLDKRLEDAQVICYTFFLESFSSKTEPSMTNQNDFCKKYPFSLKLV